MTSYSRARSLSASVRRAWSGSRLSRSLRTGRTTETPSGSATARALLIGGLAAHDVAEGKPAERDALDARDAQAGWNQRETIRCISARAAAGEGRCSSTSEQ